MTLNVSCNKRFRVQNKKLAAVRGDSVHIITTTLLRAVYSSVANRLARNQSYLQEQRDFIKSLQKRQILHAEQARRRKQIIIRTMAGQEFEVTSLHGCSTYEDFHSDARQLLKISQGTCLSLIFVSSAKTSCQFNKGDVLKEPGQNRCKEALRGCCFDAIVSNSVESESDDDEIGIIVERTFIIHY